jgi:hypothetical protein
VGGFDDECRRMAWRSDNETVSVRHTEANTGLARLVIRTRVNKKPVESSERGEQSGNAVTLGVAGSWMSFSMR